MENENFTRADQYANWLMDIAEALREFSNEIEGEADRYFDSDQGDDLGLAAVIEDNAPDSIESDQDLAEKKAAYLERLIGELSEILKSV